MTRGLGPSWTAASHGPVGELLARSEYSVGQRARGGLRACIARPRKENRCIVER